MNLIQFDQKFQSLNDFHPQVRESELQQIPDLRANLNVE
jgi:hypothetical protein